MMMMMDGRGLQLTFVEGLLCVRLFSVLYMYFITNPNNSLLRQVRLLSPEQMRKLRQREAE